MFTKKACSDVVTPLKCLARTAMGDTNPNRLQQQTQTRQACQCYSVCTHPCVHIHQQQVLVCMHKLASGEVFVCCLCPITRVPGVRNHKPQVMQIAQTLLLYCSYTLSSGDCLADKQGRHLLPYMALVVLCTVLALTKQGRPGSHTRTTENPSKAG